MEEGFNTKFTKLSLKQKELMNTQVAICKENKMLDQRGERFNDSQFIKGTQI